MSTPLLYLALGAACALAGCQHNPQADNVLRGPVEVAQPAEMKTADQARGLVGTFLKNAPNAALYVVDSAHVNDNGATWQVLVPRRDWARRMPNSVRFEVNKTTGEVSTGTVK